jgi:iron complex transport system substrate-binding protein
MSPVMARDITDMAGRHVKVPDKITKVFSASYPLMVLLYALAPDLLVASNFPIAEPAKPFVSPQIAALPAIGGTMGQGRSMNPEEVIALHPDVILAWVDPMGETEHTIRQFSKTGLPIVFADLNKLKDYPAALRFLGALLGRETRTAELATYMESAQAHVEKAVSSVPSEKRIRIYYAESRDGLATECDNSFHIEPILIAGGENVHRCTQTNHMGMERITLEQIITDKPAVILAQERTFSQSVGTDPNWRNVEAVRDGHIVEVPRLPFNWLDRPPSFMRALGIQWLANRFYPDLFPLDLKAETKRFYRLFLGVQLTDQDVDHIFR